MQYTEEQVAGAAAVVEAEGNDFTFGKPDDRDFVRMVQRGAGLQELRNGDVVLERIAEEVFEDAGETSASAEDLARFVLKRLPEPGPITGVVTPSHEQLEAAWWNLMQGELGVEHDQHTRDDVQALVDILRRAAARETPIMSADGEPLPLVGGDEVARRIAHAYADLFYGRA